MAHDDITLRDVINHIDSKFTSVDQRLDKIEKRVGKFHEAAPRARDSIRLIPDDLESYFVLADCLVNMSQGDEAFEVYQELFAIGEYQRAYLPFGLLLTERGHFTAAQAYLLEAVVTASDEDRALANYSLGHVYVWLGEFELAVQLLEEANELYPNDPGTLSLLAEAYLGGGDLESGIELFRCVIDVDPANFYAHYQLGMVLLSENQIAAARRHIEIANEITPTDSRAIEALEMIRTLDIESPN